MSSTHASTGGHQHAHHFNSAVDEFEASKQGMWLFMVTEVLMFGGLFVAYAMFRSMYPDMFHAGSRALAKNLGLTNTVILITSSLTMVLAVIAAQKGQKNRILLHLGLTFLLSCGFLVVKYFEYAGKIHHGILPGGLFSSTDPALALPKTPLFFSLYFVMTGIHAFHVIVGMGLMVWLAVRTLRNEFSPEFFTPVELVGFYWHFVDMVWIFLFPLMYLVG